MHPEEQHAAAELELNLLVGTLLFGSALPLLPAPGVLVFAAAAGAFCRTVMCKISGACHYDWYELIWQTLITTVGPGALACVRRAIVVSAVEAGQIGLFAVLFVVDCLQFLSRLMAQKREKPDFSSHQLRRTYLVLRLGLSL